MDSLRRDRDMMHKRHDVWRNGESTEFSLILSPDRASVEAHFGIWIGYRTQINSDWETGIVRYDLSNIIFKQKNDLVQS